MEGIVAGLQGYLSDVQEKANKQKHDYDKLFKEKLHLQELIHDADEEKLNMEKQTDEIVALREVSSLTVTCAPVFGGGGGGGRGGGG